jgi:type IV fimbrial biogenesis protein FimT
MVILAAVRMLHMGRDALHFPNSKNTILITDSLMNNPKQKGMTLVELVVTLAVAAILASVAVPSLREMMENNRLVALNNQLVSSINYVRGEAVKRVYDVTMCVRNSDGSDCAASGGFENGWIVFVNCNPQTNTTPDTTNVCDFNGDGVNESPEPVLQDVQPDAHGITITSNNPSTPRTITYRANGKSSSAGTLTIGSTELELDLDMNSVPRYKVAIAVTTGRVRSCKVKAGDTTC